MNMGSQNFLTRNIQADHKDLVHDIAYDFYGRRMATCSSDQTVKIFDLNENDEWVCTADWKAHSGSVWKVTWAHPEFGQVIATCSFDRTVSIWEEIVSDNTGGEQKSHWVKKTSLVDARLSVTDVKFAPKHLGLILAACSGDGYVRIYEAPDIMNLGQFNMQSEFHIKMSCSCLTWNPCLARNFSPTLAIGSDSDSSTPGSKVVIYEYNESARKWNRIESLSVVTEPVNDIAFAPNVGRSYHLLAVASKDIRVFMLRSSSHDLTSSAPTPTTALEVNQAFQSNIHGSLVWRLAWNITGTMLASCGDDGYVRLWKANYMQNWKQVAEFKGDGTFPPSQGQTQNEDESFGRAQIGHVSTKFIKAGTMGDHKSQFPWH